MMEKAKRCPMCQSNELKWVYYAIPEKVAPEMWEDMVDVGYSPMLMLKRIECKKCGATLPNVALTLDDALDFWNSLNERGNRYILQRIGEEDVREVEAT